MWPISCDQQSDCLNGMLQLLNEQVCISGLSVEVKFSGSKVMHPWKHETELDNTEKLVFYSTGKNISFPLQMLVYINMGDILISPIIPLVITTLFSAQHSYLP